MRVRATASVAVLPAHMILLSACKVTNFFSDHKLSVTVVTIKFSPISTLLLYIIYYIYNNKILSNIFPTKITVTTVTNLTTGRSALPLPKGRKTFPFVRNAFIVQEICQINSLFVSFCGRFSICLISCQLQSSRLWTNETGTFPSLNSDFPLTKVPLSPA